MSDDKSAEEMTGVALTKREKEVLKLLCEASPNAEIARKLFIQVATVKSHMTRIFRKLGVKSRMEAFMKMRDRKPDL